MKRIIFAILAVALFSVVDLCAQTVKGIPYQAVVRNAQGNPVPNQELTVRFYILRTLSTRTDADPKLLYSETHNTVSDANGLVSLQVGKGTPLEGSFDQVDWWGNISIKTEIDMEGESTFTTTQELGTVPYALSAENVLLLKSDDGTQWSLECDNEGNLKSVKIPQRYTKLVFSDEFEGTGLPDDTKWGYEEGYTRNGEEQYYTVAREENCYMADGCLHIVCRNDSALIENALYEKPWSASGSHGYRADTIIPITSASVVTKGKFAFTYGRVEVRAKLPVCLGSWPAIWMFPQDRSDWPACGEIDIIEHVGYDPGNIYFTVHSSEINGNNQPNRYASSAPIENPEDWHVYAFEWHPDRLMWFIDGELKFTVIRSRVYSDSNWPFNKDFYLLLNFAFGGGWGGREGIDVEALPREYVIDYVRVYQ